MLDENTSYPKSVGRLLRSLLMDGEPKDILADAPTGKIKLLLKYLKENSEVYGIDLSSNFAESFENLPREQLIPYAYNVIYSFACAAEFEHSNALVDNLLHLDPERTEDGIRATPTRTSWEDRFNMSSGGSHKIRLRNEKKHWLPVGEVFSFTGKSYTRENSDALRICIQEFSKKREHKFEVDGKSYSFDDLFGFHQHQSNYTYYINPIAIPMLMDTLGWQQKLPNDGIKRISISEMTFRIFKTTKPSRIQLVRDTVNDLLSASEGNNTKPLNELIGYFNIHGGNNKARLKNGSVLFVAEELQEIITKKLNLAPFLPEDKKHFVSENYILKTSGFFGYAKMRPYYRQALTELIQEAASDTCYSEMIGFYRHESAQSYHVDPALRDSLFTAANIVARAKQIEAKNFDRSSGQPEPRPEEKKHWIAPGAVAEQLGFRTPEGRKATQDILKDLYEAGNEDIGCFRLRGSGQGYYINPEAISRTITKEMIANEINKPQTRQR